MRVPLALENPVPWGREARGAGMAHPPLRRAPGLYSQMVPVERGRSGPSRRGPWARAVLAVTGLDLSWWVPSTSQLLACPGVQEAASEDKGPVLASLRGLFTVSVACQEKINQLPSMQGARPGNAKAE
ncbi:FH2 domain-containing protein 1-like [Platysternon megacephalum]|uniref:FH2 domain-containing protein 1-like n=1 Tax=Platysternon megacephalum TaxID=55544 RepID=A0A4D9DK98_9SAUR|nr:FH2 domain-containing protein 1-like [Platysternon megacephalum]